ncbi:enoyl-CoA hydratase-related protein [Nocardia testacea]|uniref:enoyl-CoA hydratase-related protein n=1 Tax=Nocardia testacea TaxID=248551 RepID=UPI003A83FF18
MTDRHSMNESGPEAAAEEEFLVERRGPVTVLTLNRPQARNALNGALIAGIGATVLAAEQDSGTRALVLTAAGDRAFCAGMDLRAFSGGEDVGFGDTPENRAFQRLTRGAVEVPVIGAANGTAVGGGLELLLGCDLIVAAETAKFGLPEVQRGLFPGGGGTYIAERIPLGIALQLTLTGESFTAARGYEIGLVNAVVPAGQVLETALAFADRIAANGPLGVAACKELVRLSVTDPAKAAQRLRHWQSVVFASEDAKEGATAFMEKRAPVWQGK